MRVLALCSLCFFVVLFAQNALAGACYSRLQAEAEQGIRIHSELMVIGLNCQHMAKRYNMDLYSKYRAITSEHAGLFEMYEDTLMSFFKNNGDKKPEARLNALRTGFANKISNDVASMRPDIFCGLYAKRINRVSDMGESAIREWASTFYDSHPVSYPLCEKS